MTAPLRTRSLAGNPLKPPRRGQPGRDPGQPACPARAGEDNCQSHKERCHAHPFQGRARPNGSCLGGGRYAGFSQDWQGGMPCRSGTMQCCSGNSYRVCRRNNVCLRRPLRGLGWARACWCVPRLEEVRRGCGRKVDERLKLPCLQRGRDTGGGMGAARCQFSSWCY